MSCGHLLPLLSALILVCCAQAQDCKAPVGRADMDLKDGDILLEQFPDGTKVTYKCNVGFKPVQGSSVIRCTAGRWSTLTLRCARKNCGSAGNLLHGTIDYSMGTEFGAQIVISCKPGYLKVGGSEMSCGDQGWIGRLPSCEVVMCDPPAEVADGTFTPQNDDYSYREVVEYSCQKGLTLNGTGSLSCEEDGTFKPDPPTCIKVQCAEFEIENGEWVQGARPPFLYHAAVTYRCLTGYRMVGAQTVSCQLDSNWSPALPKCEKVPTPTKPPTTTTTTTTNTTITTTTTNTTTTTSPTATPKGNGSKILQGVGGFFAAALSCLALGFGCWKLAEKMKGSGKGNPGKKVPQPDEEVALSDQKGPKQIPADAPEAAAAMDTSTPMSERNNV